MLPWVASADRGRRRNRGIQRDRHRGREIGDGDAHPLAEGTHALADLSEGFAHDLVLVGVDGDLEVFDVIDALARTWDAVGNLVTLVDSTTGTTHYTYDADDRLLSASGPAGPS